MDDAAGQMIEPTYDVVVVGGGAAGLSGALAMSRARRSVLVIDAGEPRNAPAGHVHNYLGREGTPPGELLAIGRDEVSGYGGTVVRGTVTGVAGGLEDGFRVSTADGAVVRARRLLVTTGLVDELPDVPGLRERWGRDVLHCPYCHGYEVCDQPLGILGTGPFAVHQSLLFRQWSNEVTLFQHTAPDPTDEEREQLAARGVRVVTGAVAGLELTDDAISGVRMATGDVVGVRAVVVAPRFTARSEVLAGLGLEPAPAQMGGYEFGSFIVADPMTGATAVPGVYVAGNITDLRAQVITSAARGLEVGAAINGDLVMEDTRDAVAGHRTKHAPMDVARLFDEDFWEDRYRTNPALWSGRPNAQLVAEVSDLAPGTALDVGCGEGADVLWLAARGWSVTGVDFASAALRRAADNAARAGVAERTDWVHADVTSWTPPGQHFDLVSAHFMHLPVERLRPLFARLATAVAPGGTLLLVGHHPHDAHGPLHRPDVDAFFLATDVAATLDPELWEVQVAEDRDRETADAHGRPVTIKDTVLRARRR